MGSGLERADSPGPNVRARLEGGGPSRRPRVLQRGGNRAHSRIVPAGRRISTLSTSCGSGISRTEHDGSGIGSGNDWRWGADSGSCRLPHLGQKSKATPSVNHFCRSGRLKGRGRAQVKETTLKKVTRGGGGGGGGGLYLKRSMGMRKGRKTKRFRAGQKFRAGPNFALCEISRRQLYFAQTAPLSALYPFAVPFPE